MQKQTLKAGLIVIVLCLSGSRNIEPSPMDTEAVRQLPDMERIAAENVLPGTFRYVAGEDCMPGGGECDVSGGGGDFLPRNNDDLSFVIAPQAITCCGEVDLRPKVNYIGIPLRDLQLSWLQSAVWLDANEMVILTDSVGRRVAELSLGDSTGVTIRNRTKFKLLPTFASTINDGYIQIMNNSTDGTPREAHRFDKTLTERDIVPFAETRDSEGAIRATAENGLIAIYSWTAIDQKRIFAYGMLDNGRPRGASHPYRSGFFTYELGAAAARSVEAFGQPDYYTLGLPYMVTVDHEVYYLEMDFLPALKYFNSQKHEKPVYLAGLPGGEEPLPPLDHLATASELVGALEGAQMPAGLYSDEGYLYLLRRGPKGSATEWSLTKLSPEPESWYIRDLGTVYLPTVAPHLTVLFTSRSVLVFEKSSVPPGSKTQDVERMLELPKGWITDPGTSPLK